MKLIVHWSRPCLLLTAGVVLLVAPSECMGAEGVGRLTEEDVVRLFVAGVPADALIERIRAAEADFDLSEEIRAELRLAGLPAPVLEAMAQRQAEQDRVRARTAPAPDAAPDAGETDVALVRIRFGPWADEPREAERQRLRVAGRIDAAWAERWRLHADETEVTDLALFVACLTADHVPDHWRGRSPLGRDFVSMPRHRLLAFHGGAERVEPEGWRQAWDRARGRAVSGGESRLELVVPTSFEVLLEREVAHDLMLGVAVRLGGRYFLAAHDLWAGLVPGSTPLELRAAVNGASGGDLRSVRVSFVRGEAAAN